MVEQAARQPIAPPSPVVPAPEPKAQEAVVPAPPRVEKPASPVPNLEKHSAPEPVNPVSLPTEPSASPSTEHTQTDLPERSSTFDATATDISFEDLQKGGFFGTEVQADMFSNHQKEERLISQTIEHHNPEWKPEGTEMAPTFNYEHISVKETESEEARVDHAAKKMAMAAERQQASQDGSNAITTEDGKSFTQDTVDWTLRDGTGKTAITESVNIAEAALNQQSDQDYKTAVQHLDNKTPLDEGKTVQTLMATRGEHITQEQLAQEMQEVKERIATVAPDVLRNSLVGIEGELLGIYSQEGTKIISLDQTKTVAVLAEGIFIDGTTKDGEREQSADQVLALSQVLNKTGRFLSNRSDTLDMGGQTVGKEAKTEMSGITSETTIVKDPVTGNEKLEVTPNGCTHATEISRKVLDSFGPIDVSRLAKTPQQEATRPPLPITPLAEKQKPSPRDDKQNGIQQPSRPYYPERTSEAAQALQKGRVTGISQDVLKQPRVGKVQEGNGFFVQTIHSPVQKNRPIHFDTQLKMHPSQKALHESLFLDPRTRAKLQQPKGAAFLRADMLAARVNGEHRVASVQKAMRQEGKVSSIDKKPVRSQEGEIKPSRPGIGLGVETNRFVHRDTVSQKTPIIGSLLQTAFMFAEMRGISQKPVGSQEFRSTEHSSATIKKTEQSTKKGEQTREKGKSFLRLKNEIKKQTGVSEKKLVQQTTKHTEDGVQTARQEKETMIGNNQTVLSTPDVSHSTQQSTKTATIHEETNGAKEVSSLVQKDEKLVQEDSMEPQTKEAPELSEAERIAVIEDFENLIATQFSGQAAPETSGKKVNKEQPVEQEEGIGTNERLLHRSTPVVTTQKQTQSAVDSPLSTHMEPQKVTITTTLRLELDPLSHERFPAHDTNAAREFFVGVLSRLQQDMQDSI